MDIKLANLLQTPLHQSHLTQLHALITTKFTSLTPLLLKNLLTPPIQITYAHRLFDQIPHPQSHHYIALIYAHSKLNNHHETIRTLFSMHQNNATDNITHFAFPPVLKSCTALSAFKQGVQMHCLVLKYGFCSNNYIECGLIDFYAKQDDLDSAKRVFDGIVMKEPVSYNCLISGYSKCGEVEKARELFNEMEERSVVSWNAMISCYLRSGELHEGWRVFETMQGEEKEYCDANEFTFATALSICAKMGDITKGLRVKKLIEESGLCNNMIVSTAVLEMYVKCGAVDEARREFDQMKRRDIVTWSAMIAGYAQNGRSDEALDLFDDMINAKVEPNDVALVSVLSSCGKLGSVEAGKRLGSYIESQGLELSVYVVTALLDMYGRIGNIRKARQLFDQLASRDVVPWNSMIGGLANHGFAKEAIDLFMDMKDAKVTPNDITFVNLLTACTHAGLVEQGCAFFKSMRVNYNIVPQVEHYSCIVDLYCKSGRLKDAYNFIAKMEVQPNVVVWGTLLSACRIHLNVELAECAVEKLLELDPESSGNYVQLSNIYSSVGRWQDALKIRNLMKDRGLQKISAYSWIEMDDMVHKFLVEDTSHPISSEIYDVIDRLGLQLLLTRDVLDFDLELL